MLELFEGPVLGRNTTTEMEWEKSPVPSRIQSINLKRILLTMLRSSNVLRPLPNDTTLDYKHTILLRLFK